MNVSEQDNKASEIVTNRPLRIWIPLLLIPLIGIARYFPTWFPEITMVWAVGAFGPLLVSLLLILWWLLFSRATFQERGLGLIGVIASLLVVGLFVDRSMLGPIFIVLTLPMCVVAFSIAIVLMHRTSAGWRTVVSLLIGFSAAAFSLCLRNDGAWGDFSFGLSWRWKASPEESFLANLPTKSNDSNAVEYGPTFDLDEQPHHNWVGFRGNGRDGTIQGITFEKDWRTNPPLEIWRIQVGPGWSSFAAVGNAVVTLEQRGEEETVACYDKSTGSPFWATPTYSRFFDGLGGLGPRGTPTIDQGFVYTFGAEGWLSKIEGKSGKLVWQVDVRPIAGRQAPEWGYSGSPLVWNDLVIIHAAGEKDKGILAMDTKSGELRWSAAVDSRSYSSPHLIKIGELELVGMMTAAGLSLLEPRTGEMRLDYAFPSLGYRALQPAVIDDRRIVISNEVVGTRLIQVDEVNGNLEAKELWTTRNLKPDFNDLVVHDGHLYGYDGAILTCIDLADGKRKWKGGRYGKGQILLLADSSQIVVLSETGELVLIEASPTGHNELYKIQALDGKSWNHLAVAGDLLFVRNSREAVCYRLPRAREKQ
ncbi:PQQ-binding-like beta-propeller repeat protein [Pirellulaceae bacterium SH449]